MNDLAHFHLAACHGAADALIGALLGDYLKGPLDSAWPEHWPQRWRAGVLLHRRIDAYCDSHPVLAAQRRTFSPRMRRFGGIVLDVGMDHLLARHWSRFHPGQELPAFAAGVYAALEPVLPLLPEAAHRRARRIIRHDALSHFRHREAVPATLARIGERLSRPTPLLDAGPEFERLLPQIERSFLDFYPQLMHWVRHHALADQAATAG